MKNIIFNLLEKPDTSIVMSTPPQKVNESLNDLGWDIVQDYLAESREDWSCAEYVSEYYPEFKIIMQWNGWTEQVELVATCIGEEGTLTKGLRRVLANTHSVMVYQDYDFVEINKFIESRGWELCRATATIRRGWCHYIYRNIDYPNRKLILAWDPVFNITELRTAPNDEVEDK